MTWRNRSSLKTTRSVRRRSASIRSVCVRSVGRKVLPQQWNLVLDTQQTLNKKFRSSWVSEMSPHPKWMLGSRDRRRKKHLRFVQNVSHGLKTATLWGTTHVITGQWWLTWYWSPHSDLLNAIYPLIRMLFLLWICKHNTHTSVLPKCFLFYCCFHCFIVPVVWSFLTGCNS